MVCLYGFIFSTSSRLKWKTSIVRALSSHSRNKSTTDTSLSSWSIALIARPVIIKKCGAMPNKRVSRYLSFFLVPIKLSPQSFSFYVWISMNYFQVYIGHLSSDPATCSSRNIHKRSEKEITDLAATWEPTPSHFNKVCPSKWALKFRSFLSYKTYLSGISL